MSKHEKYSAEIDRAETIAQELFRRNCSAWFTGIREKIENLGNKQASTVYTPSGKREKQA